MITEDWTLVATAIQMLSDILPWWPSASRNNVADYTRVSKDIWNSSTDDVDADTTISFSAPSEIIEVTHFNMPGTCPAGPASGRAMRLFATLKQLASGRIIVIGR